MKALVAVVVLAVAGLARAEGIGCEGARHLLNRAGFGATDVEVREYAPLDRLQAVERLVEIGRWDSTVVATYAEFGRRPRENQSGAPTMARRARSL